jgi:hypothetical protein
MTALAGLVPCADVGDQAHVRWLIRRARRWYARITSRPAYSPCEPALGWSETAAKPVISRASVLELLEQLLVALRSASTGANGWSAPELGPGDRDHLGRGVELHRAGAERNHRGVSERSRALEPRM